MNGTRHGQQPSTTSISDSLTLHDLSGEDTVDDHDEGDYSARLEELLKDDEGEHKSADGAQDEDDEEGFFYTGVDSQPSGTYREQLRDVLGPENEDDEQEEEEVEKRRCRGRSAAITLKLVADITHYQCNFERRAAFSAPQFSR